MLQAMYRLEDCVLAATLSDAATCTRPLTILLVLTLADAIIMLGGSL